MRSLTIQRQASHIRHHDERANKITFVSSLGSFHGFCSQYHFHTETRHTILTSHAKSVVETTDDNVNFMWKKMEHNFFSSPAGLSAMWIHSPSTNIQEHFYQVQRLAYSIPTSCDTCTPFIFCLLAAKLATRSAYVVTPISLIPTASPISCFTKHFSKPPVFFTLFFFRENKIVFLKSDSTVDWQPQNLRKATSLI